MKILVVSDVPTSPVITGSRKLIHSYTDLFRRWGHEVHFLQINRYNLRARYRKTQSEGIEHTKLQWGEYYHQYDYSKLENIKSNIKIILDKILYNEYRKVDDIYPKGLNIAFAKLNREYKFDAVIVNYFYLSKVLDVVPFSRKALFTHDSFSMQQKTSVNKAAYYLKKSEEQKALLRAPYIFAMQDVEAAYFKSLSPKSTVLINYSNFIYKTQPRIGNHNILYLSGASNFNKSGLVWFINNVFTLIKSKYGDAKLCVAGNICRMLLEYETRDDIDLIGKIEDPYNFFMKGDVAINPCQQGTGLKIKTFESMSFDKVTMVHPHSVIGIFKKESAPLFSSEKPEEWLSYLDKVWNEDGFIDEVKERTRNYMYDMNKFIESQYMEFLTCIEHGE